MKTPTLAIATAAALALALLILSHAAALQVGYYRGKCGAMDVEVIIRDVVAARFNRDPTVVAALLQMHFHDCFVNGCDASILLDGPSTEKKAAPNSYVRGFDLIDEVKVAVESACPGVVSCADIIVAATRDVVVMETHMMLKLVGEMEEHPSIAKNFKVLHPSISVPGAIQAFQKRGINATDMVILLGGHTLGVSHCSFFADRLYNYNNTGKTDPTMDQSFATEMKAKCPKNATKDSKVDLKQESSLNSNAVDNGYYKQIITKKSILHIDQSLAFDPETKGKGMVASLANGSDFTRRFGEVMIKLGAIKVLNETEGEIRKSCRHTN